MKPEMARLTLVRKIAAIALTLWKKEERFDTERLSHKQLERHTNSGDLPSLSCLSGGPSVLRCSGSRESIHSLIRRSGAGISTQSPGQSHAPSDNPKKP
jgi:hypothetical protein